MAYVKILYQDSPSTATPMNAQNLNHMDNQIALNDQRLTDLEGAHVSSFNGRTGAVTPADGDYNIGQIAPLTGAQVGQVPVVTNIGTEEDPELVFRMGAGGGGGHSIIDSSGNTMPQESAMQFADSFVSDDSVNDRTVVENIKAVTQAQYPSQTEDGTYLITDGEGAVIEPASDDKVEVTASSDTWATLLKKLYAEIDFTKLKKSSLVGIKVGNEENIFIVVSINNTSNITRFTKVIGYTTNQIETLHLMSVTECYYYYNSSDVSSTSISDGTKITLYYGNKKATVDLQTTANRCWMSDGETSVEDELNYSGKKRTYYGIALSNNAFVVILPPNIVEKGSPVSITSHRIVEMAVGGRSYSRFDFNENGLIITTVDTNMTMGHAIRFTATITW